MRPAVTILGAVVAVVVAMDSSRTQSPPETLHDAWLGELLDLDHPRAAAAYAAIAGDGDQAREDRLLAAVRLLELQRLGAGPILPVPADLWADLPPAILDSLQQTPAHRAAVDRLVERARSDPDTLFTWLQTHDDRWPTRLAVRPLMLSAQAMVLDATVSPSRELRRTLTSQLQEAARRGDRVRAAEIWRQLRLLDQQSRDPRRADRLRAMQVLGRELDGSAAEADQLRQRWFPDLAAMTPPADPVAALAEARPRLTALRRANDLLPGEAELLDRLAAQLTAVAERDGAAAAIQLLLRLPVYRDRLLTP